MLSRTSGVNTVSNQAAGTNLVRILKTEKSGVYRRTGPENPPDCITIFK
jgi:hypothetical protein